MPLWEFEVWPRRISNLLRAQKGRSLRFHCESLRFGFGESQPRAVLERTGSEVPLECIEQKHGWTWDLVILLDMPLQSLKPQNLKTSRSKRRHRGIRAGRGEPPSIVGQFCPTSLRHRSTAPPAPARFCIPSLSNACASGHAGQDCIVRALRLGAPIWGDTCERFSFFGRFFPPRLHVCLF